jgi:hypothetical protein
VRITLSRTVNPDGGPAHCFIEYAVRADALRRLGINPPA